MTTTFNNQYTAASLYDGDWRAEYRDQLIDEYQLTDEEADDICRGLAEIADRRWYAVQETREDAWDYGSHSYDEAVQMLKEQGEGLIAVINEQTGVCEKEIGFEEV